MVDDNLLKVLGVTVVEVPDLDVELCYVEDRRVVLIREGLRHQDRRRALNWLFGRLPGPVSPTG